MQIFWPLRQDFSNPRQLCSLLDFHKLELAWSKSSVKENTHPRGEWDICIHHAVIIYNCCISVTFVDKDGEEHHIKVPIGMSMLEAAHENDIEIEDDMEYYYKLEDPADEENDMLDLAFGLTETSRLGCKVIASPELDGILLALPAATRNFAINGYTPKPH